MKFSSLLALAPFAAAFVIPDETITDRLYDLDLSNLDDLPSPEELRHVAKEYLDSFVEHSEDKVEEYADWTADLFDDAVKSARTAAGAASAQFRDAYHRTEKQVDDLIEKEKANDRAHFLGFDDEGHGHHGGHHHHHKPNLTVYQLIAESKYTTKLAAAINEYPDLVDALNGTEANYTVFAPTDRAFEKIPEHAPKPSKEELKKILTYHVSPHFYPAGRVLASRTIPTLLDSDELGSEPRPQRVGIEIGFRGLTVNFLSRIIAIDIFGTNGVIHGIDSLLFIPPEILNIIQLVPGEFSTLELALVKTGLDEGFNSSAARNGGTLFAPSNGAFQRLGPRANAFLFSPYGLKYLKALVKYHVVPKTTLYSDAIYAPDREDSKLPFKGIFHAELPTLLKDRSLGVDIARYGRFIEVKVNGFFRTQGNEAVAENGVIHTLNGVLIPPKKLDDESVDEYDGGEIEVDDLKERLEPLTETQHSSALQKLLGYEL